MAILVDHSFACPRGNQLLSFLGTFFALGGVSVVTANLGQLTP